MILTVLGTGNKGAPRTLENATSTHTVNTACGTRRYYILDLQYLFLAKLRSLNERESLKDYDDLVWMSFSHSQTVREFAARLDDDLKGIFAAQYAEENEFDPSRVTWLYDLLGLHRNSSSSSSRDSSRSTGSRDGGGARRTR